MDVISAAHDVLDDLCGKVRLTRNQPRLNSEPGHLPDGVALWSGEYACLLLWPINGCNVQDFEKGAAKAQDYIDQILTSKEVQSGYVDGYLVLALTEEPSGSLDIVVRNLELSTNVCRKNIIWPSVNESKTTTWCRISDISVLGLPDAAQDDSVSLVWPKLSDEARALWLNLDKGIVPKTEVFRGR